MNQSYSLCGKEEIKHNQKLSACYTFSGLKKIKVDKLESGDIIALCNFLTNNKIDLNIQIENLLDLIVEKVKPAALDKTKPFAMLSTLLYADSFLG